MGRNINTRSKKAAPTPTTQGVQINPTITPYGPPQPIDLSSIYGAPFPIFTDKEGDRFTKIKDRLHAEPRDFKLDEVVRLAEEEQDPHFSKVLDNIKLLGGLKVGKLPPVTYKMLTLEFVTTFCETHGGGFYCRLKGEVVKVDLRELNSLFGLTYEGERLGQRPLPEGYDNEKWWKTLSGLPSNGEERLKARLIRNDVLFATYKFIGHSIFSKDEASKLNKVERQILWCLHHGKKPCLPPLIFDSIKRVPGVGNGRLIFGSFASALALKRGIAITQDSLVKVQLGNVGPRTDAERAHLMPDDDDNDDDNNDEPVEPQTNFDPGQSSRGPTEPPRPSKRRRRPPPCGRSDAPDDATLREWKEELDNQRTIVRTLDRLVTGMLSMQKNFDDHQEYVRARLPKEPLRWYQDEHPNEFGEGGSRQDDEESDKDEGNDEETNEDDESGDDDGDSGDDGGPTHIVIEDEDNYEAEDYFDSNI